MNYAVWRCGQEMEAHCQVLNLIFPTIRGRIIPRKIPTIGNYVH